MPPANYQFYWNFDILYLPYSAFNFTKIDWIRLYPYKKTTLVSQFFPLYRTHEIGQETGFSERCLRSFILFQLPRNRITLFPLLHSMCYPSNKSCSTFHSELNFPNLLLAKSYHYCFKHWEQQFQTLRTTAYLLYCNFSVVTVVENS